MCYAVYHTVIGGRYSPCLTCNPGVLLYTLRNAARPHLAGRIRHLRSHL